MIWASSLNLAGGWQSFPSIPCCRRQSFRVRITRAQMRYVEAFASYSLVISHFALPSQILTIICMLSESSSLFYRPKDKKLHADQARQNFVRAGGDQFTLLNVWEQWAETNYSQQFCYEQFLQFKSLSRARDIRDQLAGLCERVEVVIQGNPNTNDITPIQKALTAG